jgi:hypothetical protein
MDFVLQAEVYLSMLCEQGDTQAEDIHAAFMSCGFDKPGSETSDFLKN